MLFTLEAKKGILDLYRLKDDGTWRKVDKGHALRSGDYSTYDPYEIMERSSPDIKIVIGNSEVIVDNSALVKTLGEIGESYYWSSHAFHEERPKTPSREQLKAVIMAGDDSETNYLILKANGMFELRISREHTILHNDPRVVVRHEGFSAGNDYVGLDAATDSHHLDALYQSSLYYWLSHLKTGVVHFVSDIPVSESIESLVDKIEKVELAPVF